MKKIFIILCLSMVSASCGPKDNKVSSGNITASGSEGLEGNNPNAFTVFTGDYDILRKESHDCSNTIRIVAECNGVKILSNGFNPAEEFCDINKGIQRTTRTGTINDRNPPNPDMIPPHPNNNGETKIVTLSGNILKSELRISPRIAFTNTLTMKNDGVLIKDSDLKKGRSICIYTKRFH